MLTATHDYQDDGQTNAYSGDEKVKIPAAKREELFEMYREFGPDEAISVHRDSMSYVVQLQDGYRLFAINDDRNLQGKAAFPTTAISGFRNRRKMRAKTGSLSLR